MPAVERLTLGPFENPVRGLLHGSGALAAAALAAHFARHGPEEPAARAALLVFALSQFALYLASALYHTVPWGPAWKGRMQRVDHSFIYVKIAGTLTPVAWVALEGPERAALLGAAWGTALLGIAQKALLPRVRPKACIPVQVAQGLLAVPALAAFAERFPGRPAALGLCGAALYAVGALVFLSERPRLWPRVFSHHELFHALTVAASAAHYALALRYLARLP